MAAPILLLWAVPAVPSPPSKGTVLDHPLVWLLGVRLPGLFTGTALHRAALHAAAAGSARRADALFERAADHFRMDLEVEALARVRVHQLITRARATRGRPRAGAVRLEAEKRLARLRRIESLVPPFELIPACRLLRSGVFDPPGAAPAKGGRGTRREAA
jgi:hypothetical protein